MKVTTVKSEGLAHNSYYLSDKNEAAVVDPRRDCDIYIQLAKEDCAKIRYILETHRNEDCAAGSLELQTMTEAEIGHSNALPFNYGEDKLSDGDVLHVGNVRIRALYTPGHTNESLCYTAYPMGGNEAKAVFTGDTLFAGSVGRTDLYGKPNQPEQAEKLYQSVQEKLLPLGDHVLVYPAHGQGSVCGHGITGMEPTTLGYERKTNPYMQLNKVDFIDRVLNEELVVPRYFKKMEELNLNGPPLLSEMSYPQGFSLLEFEEKMAEPNMVIIDTRMPYAFAGAHIPNSISLWLGGTSVYPGWLFDTSQYVVFVHERPSDIDLVAPRFRRLGFDNMCGYLCGGMNQWQEAGNPFRNYKTLTATESKEKLMQGQALLLDVRDPPEWTEDGYAESAKLMFFADLPQRTVELPRDKPIIATCSVGNRTSIALSILERAGFMDISNMLGGMTAWTNLGYPTKKGL
jgi:hydroxyacylglutathione hydrolase